MRRFALIAIATLTTLFVLTAFNTSAEAGPYGRKGYENAAYGQMRYKASRTIFRDRNRRAAAIAGAVGVASLISGLIASSYRIRAGESDYTGLTPGVVVGYNPDLPHYDAPGNPCTFERVHDAFGRSTSRVVKICR